jgi:hypothetical protein
MLCKKISLFIFISFSGLSLSAQTFSIVVEPGSILDSIGVSLNHTNQAEQGLNFFYAETTSSIVDLQNLFSIASAPEASEFSSFSSLSWSALPDIALFSSEFWATPGWFSGTKVNRVTPGARILLGIFDASNVGDIAGGSQVGFLASTNVIPNLGNIDYNFAAFETVVGVTGSLQLVNVVPEPSAYAALAGLLALGVVMVRRRRA